MKKILFAIVLLSTSFLFSCNSGGDDPKAVLSQFFDALSKKDIAAARKLATEESKSMLDMMEMGMKMSNDSKETEKYDKSKMQFGDAKIEGDKAVVPVKELTSGETLNYTLKKEKGSWKVAFDKSSLMSMGMDKMGEKGTGAADSLSQGLDELKNLNMDSLKDGINKSLDSANKELKKLN